METIEKQHQEFISELKHAGSIEFKSKKLADFLFENEIEPSEELEEGVWLFCYDKFFEEGKAFISVSSLEDTFFFENNFLDEKNHTEEIEKFIEKIISK